MSETPPFRRMNLQPYDATDTRQTWYSDTRLTTELMRHEQWLRKMLTGQLAPPDCDRSTATATHCVVDPDGYDPVTGSWRVFVYGKGSRQARP